MLTTVAALFAKPTMKYGAIAVAVLLIFGAGFAAYNSIYNKGSKAGASEVKGAVQTETIKRVEKARETKEKADEEVRRTPYDDRVDGLR